MLLVNVLAPCVYAGANIFIADCLVFFSEYIGDHHSVVHWCGWEDLAIFVAKVGECVVYIFKLG
jgi:hypothetical protein